MSIAIAIVIVSVAVVAPWATKSVLDVAGRLASWGWATMFVAAHVWAWRFIAASGDERLFLPAIMLAVYEFIVISFVPMTLEEEEVCRCTTCEQHRCKAVKKG